MSLDPEPPELTPPALPADSALAADQAAAHVTAEGHGDHGPFHTHCENCGTKLEGPFCHRCGQHDFEFHRSFRHVFMEALETIFHFEGKFFRNIVTLLFRPGRLTADFNAGKRAAQMPPFRLYIFVSFLFFLLIFLGKEDEDFVRSDGDKPRRGFTVNGKPVDVAAIGGTWRDTAAKMKSEDWKDPAKVAAAIEEAAEKTDQTLAATAKDGETASAAAPAEQKPKRLVDQIREAAEQAKADVEKAGGAKVKENKPASLRYLESQLERLSDAEHRHRVAESFKHHLPQMLMMCLPLFALYTRFLFRKSGQVYLQHLVLAVHFHTFIYLWILCRNGWAALAGLAPGGLDIWVASLATLWMYVYPVVMLRRLFANSWKKTIAKTFLLTFAYGITLSVGFAAMAVAVFVLAA
jgi:hypothetical protein